MISLRTLKGRRVIAHDNAERIGTVETLVVDADSTSVRALHVGGKKAKSRFVSWDEIGSIGDDAVMTRTATPHAPQDELEQRVADGVALTLGARVLEESGDELGSVDDVAFDGETGAIESLRVADNDISSDRLLGIGSFAIVVASAADDQ